jgi:hypothetical protein
MAITTSNSMRVKRLRFMFVLFLGGGTVALGSRLLRRQNLNFTGNSAGNKAVL